MRISDWNSDVCSSDLPGLEGFHGRVRIDRALLVLAGDHAIDVQKLVRQPVRDARNVNLANSKGHPGAKASGKLPDPVDRPLRGRLGMRVGLQQNISHGHRFPPASPFLWHTTRSEEHTSELQSLMRISYAVFCLKKKKNNHKI